MAYNVAVKIVDSRGRSTDEVTLRLEKDEVAELLVAASQIDDGTLDHALVRDGSGRTIAVYADDGEDDPLRRQIDWWLGPLVLAMAVLMAVGAFTVARGLIRLFF